MDYCVACSSWEAVTWGALPRGGAARTQQLTSGGPPRPLPGLWGYSRRQTRMERELDVQMVVFKCFIFDTIKT